VDYDGDVDRAGGSMPPWARFDMPAFYFGWYTGDLNGPFAQPGFTFPAGAIASYAFGRRHRNRRRAAA